MYKSLSYINFKNLLKYLFICIYINRIASLVVGIEQEVEREPFRVCLMLQNRVVQSREQKESCFSSSLDEIAPFFPSSFICRDKNRTVSKDAICSEFHAVVP